MPGRTSSVWITPPIGAVTGRWSVRRPPRSTAAIVAIGDAEQPQPLRVPRRSAPASPVRRTARYSACAPPHSGTSTSAIGAPARTMSPGRAAIDALDEARRTCLDDRDVALVEVDRAGDRRACRRQELVRSTSAVPHAEALHRPAGSTVTPGVAGRPAASRRSLGVARDQSASP